MSDEVSPPDETPEQAPTETPPGTSGEAAGPRSAAAAARRARRIGGRVPGVATPASPAEAEAVVEKKAEGGRGSRLRRRPIVVQTEPVASEEASGVETGRVDTDRAASAAWLTWLPAAVLGTGALIMAALLLIFSHGVWWGPTPPAQNSANAQKAREQVLASATSCVVTLYQYSYKTISQYEGKALACTSGTLSGQLKKAIETQVSPLATKLKAVQTAQINQVGIESVTPDGQWVLLAFGQLSVTNTNVPSGRTDPFAAELRVQQAGGKWVLVNIQSIGTPVGS